MLAGGIAHDFNNILAAILGNINLASQYLEPGHRALPLLGRRTRPRIGPAVSPNSY